jgi:hypothetical protein
MCWDDALLLLRMIQTVMSKMSKRANPQAIPPSETKRDMKHIEVFMHISL